MPSSITDPFALASQVNAVIKVRRGVEADRLVTVIDNGEIIFSNDKKRLFVGDGATSGGIVVGNKFWVTDSFNSLPEIQKNDFVYKTDTNGFYALTGNNSSQSSSYALIGGLEFLVNNKSSVNDITYTLPNAEEFVLGGVMVRDGLKVDDGRLSIDYDSTKLELSGNQLTIKSSVLNPTIPYASYSQNGLVKITENSGLTITDGTLNLNIDNSSVKLSSYDGSSHLYVDVSSLVLSATIASLTGLGYIQIGNGLSANNEGITEIKKASTTQLGGVIVGDGLRVDEGTGTISLSNYSQSQITLNGYATLPSGLIMQWGVLSGVSLNQNYQLITFPTTFVNNIFNVQGTLAHDVVTNGTLGVSVRNLLLSSFEICGTSVSAVSGDIYWQALGK
jgi:hypothetical protein